MALSFFRALNPASKKSGVVYCLAGDWPCQNEEMIDTTVAQSVRNAFNKDLDFFSGLSTTYNIIVGNHYDTKLNGRFTCEGGAKGALDYLIFPLIARKLISDSFLNERNDDDFSKILSLIIAIPLELVRFSAATALTLLLIPIVALVHIIKACLPKNDAEETLPSPGIV